MSQILSACSASVASIESPPDLTRLENEARVTASDRAIADQNVQSALEKSVSGTPVSWNNPSTGARGTVTPVRTWKTANGTYCRSYRERIRLATGKTVSNEGVACRTSNAVWKAA